MVEDGEKVFSTFIFVVVVGDVDFIVIVVDVEGIVGSVFDFTMDIIGFVVDFIVVIVVGDSKVVVVTVVFLLSFLLQ